MADDSANPAAISTSGQILPRVTIQFCTQCKWMLRAAYFAQELLSTFSLSLGEVALQPSTGGTFVVTIYTQQTGAQAVSPTVLWDRKVDGGFPETKELKRRVRDVIDPDRDLGHVDRHHGKPAAAAGKEEEETRKKGTEEATGVKGAVTAAASVAEDGQKPECEDCR